MNPLFRWMLRRLQRKCKHDPARVTADICQGDWAEHQMMWCRDCGAYNRVTVFQHGHDNLPHKTGWHVPWLTSTALFLCPAVHTGGMP